MYGHDWKETYTTAPAPSAGVAPAPAEQVQGGGRYRVGDRVRVVKDGKGGSSHGARVGDVLPIALIAECDAVFAGGWYLFKGEFAPAFRPGDRVRLNRHSGIRVCGDRGSVSSVLGDQVAVRMDHPSLFGALVAAFPAEVLDWERAEDVVVKPKPKFKAGDVVRCLKNADGQFTKGKLYTIRGEQRGYSVGVERDDKGSRTNGWESENFELVTAAPCPQDNEQHETTLGDILEAALTNRGIVHQRGSEDPCIVAIVKDGKPRPSQWPFVHPSVAAATTEAERLAKNNPGQEFAVYQRVAGRVAEVSYAMKEVA